MRFMLNRNPVLITFIVGLVFSSCKQEHRTVDPAFHFELVDPGESSIDFNNKLTESDSINFLTNQYIYIGSGVGVGDFNQDGLQDIFFAGEQVSSKLYINTGAFRFEDVTRTSNTGTSRWCTGVSVVDINTDGKPDVYVSVSHAKDSTQRKNYLFINETPKGAAPEQVRFSEQAAAYGLDNNGFSTQAAFLDYDLDGDLDMYLMNHNVFQNQPNNIVVTNAAGTSVAADKFYRNDGVPAGTNHPVYHDVTSEAGIRDFGYGLGITVTDINQDGWPDVYIANDFLSNDLLWINQKNGKFINTIARSIHHQSYNSMGIDAADINNDQLPDIAVLDMQPETNYRKKTMFAGTNPIKYELEQRSGGYQPQFTRNMLQLHMGNRPVDSMSQPVFSEIGQLAGISETDWSWSVLMADFDNDGWKDIQVTNGIAKDLTNNDFLFFRSSLLSDDMSNQNPSAGNGGLDIPKLRKQLDKYGSVRTNNYFFQNNGDLTFSNKTAAVGMDIPSVSHGAAYADFDNDGDLDLVTNNMNGPAFLWKNELRKLASDSVHNFLSIRLNGDAGNPAGFGARLIAYSDGKAQFLEKNPVRGYLSSMDDRLNVGIGDRSRVDSLIVTWQDGSSQVIRDLKANQFITIDKKSAVRVPLSNSQTEPKLFTELSGLLDMPFRHDEVSYFDYTTQRLLPQKFSQLGPALATADVNGDGLMDFFVGGASFQSGRIYVQSSNGQFVGRELVAKNKTSEDLAATFFDADGDSDMDLVITEGSTEYNASNTLDRPRIYINDGKGNFTHDEAAIPSDVSVVSQAVTAADYDGDGDIDLFVGGRVLTNQYPASPRSFILQNIKGKFTDVTASVCAALVKPGMITSASWVDMNNDKLPDLVLCGDWMPVRIFLNNKGQLTEATAGSGLERLHGLWRSLVVVDMDGDGDLDIVAGNMGNNNKFDASSLRPYRLYAKDIDNNGTVDLLPAYYILNDKGEYQLFPAIDQTEFSQEVPMIKKRYLLNADYAKITIDDLFKGMDRKDMLELRCDTTASMWMENVGGNSFLPRPLPIEAQFAPVNAILVDDINGDGLKDILLAGNEYQAEVGSGRYDASYGQVLLAKGKGKFTPISPLQSGFFVEGDVKQMRTVARPGKSPLFITGVNADLMRCFELTSAGRK